MALHSEASFSPSWPEILWFICISPSKKVDLQLFVMDQKFMKN